MEHEQMKKNIKAKKYIGIIIGIAVLLFFMMPICYIRSVDVVNNKYYTKEEIIEAAGIENKHLMDLSYFAITEKLMSLPYIGNVNINYEFPGRVIIELMEKAPFAYVEFKGTYLCLNEQGQVIEQSQERYHPIPIIDGLKFDSFKNAEVLPILNQDNWFTAVEIMTELQKYNYVEKVNEIDVHNVEEIHLYVDKLDVIMGDIGDFDKKIEVLIQVYEVKGFSMGELVINPSGKSELAKLTPVT